MKRLISIKEVEAIIKEGVKTIYIDKNTIVTPSAKDLAKLNNIEFSTEERSLKVESTSSCKSILDDIDSEMLMEVFKAMMEKGLLKEMMEALNYKAPYIADCDPSGLKVVRGNTVQMDVFDTGNPNAKAFYQELVSKDESKMSAGFLTIENSRFEWELNYEEIDYVIEGTVTVEINGKTFTAHAGDVLFVPSGSKVVWGSPNKARLFYSTYPANWSDLL